MLLARENKTLKSVNSSSRAINRELKHDVFEPRTDTGSVLFSYFTCLQSTTSIFLSLFALVETISLKIWERLMSWPAKCSLPVAVRGSKSLVTVILFEDPLLPGKLDICDIPDEKTRDFTITLTGKIDQTSLKS